MELKEAGQVVPNDMVCLFHLLSYFSFTRNGWQQDWNSPVPQHQHHEHLDVPEPQYRKGILGKSEKQHLPGQGKLRGSEGMTP